jgi:DNA-binding NarL/FixJ family response regulator
MLEQQGDWHAAAGWWERAGCPYEAALARVQSDDEGALREALAAFQRLRATPAAGIAARRLRSHGVSSIARGPNRSTTGNPAQLTSRQLEILGLLVEGLTNAEIAARLFITPKTAEHHVSAILAKLGVRSRHDAAVEAVRLGVTLRRQ